MDSSPSFRVATVLVALTLVTLGAAQPAPVFQDITSRSGFVRNTEPRTKYGGPAVADLDNDGYPDLIFCHHDSFWQEIYFNTRKAFPATPFFRQPPPWIFFDMHGINPAPRSSYTNNVIFAISRGGNFGRRPTPPIVYQSTPGRQISNITQQIGILPGVGGRGRGAVFMHLKFSGSRVAPDMLVTNGRTGMPGQRNHFAYLNQGSRMSLRSINGFQFSDNSYGMAAGINPQGNDMHLIAFQVLTVYKKVGGFNLVDVSNRVLPPGINRRSVLSIAEFDYDNDGDFDLYIVRSNTGELFWQPDGVYYDYMLENRGGRFVDVTQKAGLLLNSKSRGVTTGDFNNDGFMDMYVAQYEQPDLIYINRGDGTFRRVSGLIPRANGVKGDHAVAVDYDLDGRVDLVVSQGDWFRRHIQSEYKLLRNVGPTLNYLLVRVGRAPGLQATALHAVVRVRVGGRTLSRRVGSPGDNASKSFINTLHFGLARSSRAGVVTVVWANGVKRTLRNVAANRRVQVGVF